MTAVIARPALVRAGTAEQLARIAHFRALQLPDAEELDAVATFLIGDTGTTVDRLALWGELRDDAEHLWHLITGDWDDRDLDGLTDLEVEQHCFDTADHELAHRHEITVFRLSAEIERAIWVARVRTTQMRAAA